MLAVSCTVVIGLGLCAEDSRNAPGRARLLVVSGPVDGSWVELLEVMEVLRAENASLAVLVESLTAKIAERERKLDRNFLNFSPVDGLLRSSSQGGSP